MVRIYGENPIGFPFVSGLLPFNPYGLGWRYMAARPGGSMIPRFQIESFLYMEIPPKNWGKGKDLEVTKPPMINYLGFLEADFVADS